MLYRMSNQEVEQLKNMLGKEIYSGGTCVAQDELGVAQHCQTAHYTGILQKINYDENTRELSSIVLESASGTEEIDFDPTPNNYVWDIKRGIYYKDQLILEISLQS